VNSIDPRTVLFRAVGGGGAIALMIWLSKISGVPLMWIPFATSIVMVMGSPEAPPAQPMRILGGHMVCATAGIACTMLLGFDIWVAALAIGNRDRRDAHAGCVSPARRHQPDHHCDEPGLTRLCSLSRIGRGCDPDCLCLDFPPHHRHKVAVRLISAASGP
jgi:hypothetical protein